MCGELLPESLACASCGAELQPGWKACPMCGTSVDGGGRVSVDPDSSAPVNVSAEPSEPEADSIPVQPDVVARLVPPSEMDGWLNKTLTIRQGQAGLLLVEGRFETQLDPGRHAMGTLLSSRSRNSAVAVIRTSDVRFDLTVPGLLTSDPLPLTLGLRLVVSVERPQIFWGNLVQGAPEYGQEQLASAIYPIVEEAVDAFARKHSMKDLDDSHGIGETLNVEAAVAVTPAFTRWGLRLVSLQAVGITSSAWDQAQKKRVEYAVGALEVEAALEGRKRLFDVAQESDIQRMAEETAQASGIERRLGFWERMRRAMLSNAQDEARSQSELEEVVRGADRDRLLKDSEQADLVRSIRDAGEDHTKAREFGLRRVEAEQGLELEKLELFRRYGLEQERLALEVANARQEMESRWEVQRMELDWNLEKERRLAEARRSQAEQDRQASQQARVDEARTASSVTGFERDEDRADLEMLLDMDSRRRQIRQEDEEERLRVEIDAEDRRRQMDLDTQRRRMEMQLAESREKNAQELGRIEALSEAGIEALIAVSGSEQAQMLTELARTRALSDSSPQQIMAMQAADSPEIADALKEILTAVAASGQLEQYERLIAETKESARLGREDHQRNTQMLMEMFNKSLDSVRDVSVAFSGVAQ